MSDWSRRLDELAPDQKGMVIGYAWAGKRWAARKNTLADEAALTSLIGELRSVSGGDIPGDTRAIIEVLLVDSDDPHDAAMFWYGFSYGVGQMLGREGYNSPAPRRP